MSILKIALVPLVLAALALTTVSCSCESKTVTFADTKLEAVIREVIGKPAGTQIKASKLRQITVLEAAGRDISNLAGLEHCTNLTELNLNDNLITDVSPIAQLNALTHLSLDGNTGIKELTPLCNLDSLTSLSLARTRTRDLSGVCNITSLKALDLSSNDISDLRPLSQLRNLRELDLGTNRVTDLSPLIPLAELQTLDLTANPTPDISPLAELRNLRDLTLGYMGAGDIAAVSRLTGLTRLHLGSSKAQDLSPLSRLTRLTELDLGACEADDLTPLSGLDDLRSLNLGWANISDISALANLTALEKLNLGWNTISELSPVSGMSKLTALDLGSNAVTDISPLANLTKVTTLDLGSNRISDLAALSKLRSLSNLNLGTNRITSISALSGLSALTTLHLGDNNITTISPVGKLTQLSEFDMGRNRITGISAVSGLTNLTLLDLGTNSISNITPLHKNTGLGKGDKVILGSNPISNDAVDAYLASFAAGGRQAAEETEEEMEEEILEEEEDFGDEIDELPDETEADGLVESEEGPAEQAQVRAGTNRPIVVRPVLEPDPDVGPLVCGTSSYVKGTYVWTDYVYDDHGADTEPETEADFGSPRGDLRYPDWATAGNTADLVQLQISLEDEGLQFKAILETLTDPDQPILGIALDTDPGRWVEVEGSQVSLEDNTITGSLDQFTAFAVVAKPTAQPEICSTPCPTLTPATGDTPGFVKKSKTYTSQDEEAWVQIPALTIALQSDGKPIDRIALQRVDASGSAPPNRTIIKAYQVEPEGATFDKPVSLTIKYNTAEVPQGTTSSNMGLAYYDDRFEAWVWLDDSKVNTDRKTITGSIETLAPVAVLNKKPGSADLKRLAKDDGTLSEAVVIATPDGRARINIPANTRLLDVDGETPLEISAQRTDQPSKIPTEFAVISAYELLPDQSSTDRSIHVSVRYHPGELPNGVKETDLMLVYLDAQEPTGAATLPTESWTLPAGESLGVEDLVVLTSDRAELWRYLDEHWTKIGAFESRVDTESNLMETVVPRNLLDPQDEVWQAYAVLGLRDEAGVSWLRGSGPIFDMAFVGGEPPENWQDEIQSGVLAGTRSPTAAAVRIDFGKISSKRNAEPDASAPGFHTLLHRSTVAIETEGGPPYADSGTLGQGLYQPYLAWIPEDLDRAAAMIVYLHDVNSNHLTGLHAFGEAAGRSTAPAGYFETPVGPGRFAPPAIVICPLGKQAGSDYTGAGEQHVLGAMRDAIEQLNADEERVMLAGTATGGAAAMRIGARYPDEWASLVAISGTAAEDDAFELLRKNLLHVPVRIIAGENDPLRASAERDADLLDSLGYDYRLYTILDSEASMIPAMANCILEDLALNASRLSDPARVIYSVDPDTFASDGDNGFALEYEGTYWLSGIASANSDPASVEVTSKAIAEREWESETIEAEGEPGTDLCGNAVADATLPLPGAGWSMRGIDVKPGNPQPTSPHIQAVLRNIAAVSMDAERAGIVPAEDSSLTIDSDRPAVVSIQGLHSNAGIVLDDQILGSANADGQATFEIPGGTNTVEVRHPTFVVDTVSVSPKEKRSWEQDDHEFTAKMTVLNSSPLALSGTYTAALQIHGPARISEVQTQDIFLQAGSSETASFTITQKTPGRYNLVAAPFEVKDFRITPEEAAIGEDISVSARVANVGTFPGTFDVALEWNGIPLDRQTVTLEVGDSETVRFQAVQQVRNRYDIGVWPFSIGEPEITPAEPRKGQAVSISAEVTNTSSIAWSETIVLKRNAKAIDRQAVSLEAGESQSVTFDAVSSGADSYAMVLQRPVTDFKIGTNGYILNIILGVILGVALVVIGGRVLGTRRRQ